jgi:hypothetical protein
VFQRKTLILGAENRVSHEAEEKISLKAEIGD